MEFSLNSSRLRLRQLRIDDLDFVAEMLGHPEAMRYYPKLYSRGEAQEWIERQIKRYERDGHGLWLVEAREDSTPLGQVGLCLQPVESRTLPEIGYLIHFPYWRRGFALEAAGAVRDYAMGKLQMSEVFSLIRAENKPSVGVALRLGMRDTGEVQFHGLPHRLYSLTRDVSQPS